MSQVLREIYQLLTRHIRATIRLPIWLAVALVQPIIWLALFGQLFERIVELPGFGAVSYVDFLTPGVVVMNALFGCAWSGMGLIYDVETGVVDRMLATPVNRGALIAARVLHAVLTILVQSLIIFTLAFALGAQFAGGIVGLIGVLIPALLLGAGFASLSSGLALLTRREETLIAIVNFFGLPLTFLSASFMAAGLMPAWIRTLSQGNPVNWAVGAARHAVAGEDWPAVLINSGLLGLFVVAAGGFATWSFHAYRRST
ncbi:MAG: ABC transporter permease [Alphaproteobacteria bacterium]|nr:ABC transporter permease [Alphaproteobacteria bacterium]